MAGGRTTQTPRRWLILAGVAVLIVAVLAGWAGSRIDRHTSSSAGTCDTQRVAQSSMPSLVTVHLTRGGVGSGEFVRQGGYVLTNNHVINAAADGRGISVVLSSGEELPAQLVGRDPSTDLAVLKVDSTAPLVALGRSSTLTLGQPVVAVGSPLGLSGSVTSGIVSSLGRRVAVPADHGTTADLTDAIQTDASINPGNSGGALLDCAGRLIGINTAIATVPNESGQGGGGSVGIGFAVPVDVAMPIVDHLIQHGTVPPSTDLGLTTAPVPPEAAQQLGVDGGLFVQQVIAGGLAAAAGLREGDLITSVGGTAVTSPDQLVNAVGQASSGARVPIGFLRAGQQGTATITVP